METSAKISHEIIVSVKTVQFILLNASKVQKYFYIHSTWSEPFKKYFYHNLRSKNNAGVIHKNESLMEYKSINVKDEKMKKLSVFTQILSSKRLFLTIFMTGNPRKIYFRWQELKTKEKTPITCKKITTTHK